MTSLWLLAHLDTCTITTWELNVPFHALRIPLINLKILTFWWIFLVSSINTSQVLHSYSIDSITYLSKTFIHIQPMDILTLAPSQDKDLPNDKRWARFCLLFWGSSAPVSINEITLWDKRIARGAENGKCLSQNAQCGRGLRSCSPADLLIFVWKRGQIQLLQESRVTPCLVCVTGLSLMWAT